MPEVVTYTNSKGLRFPDWAVLSLGEHPKHAHYESRWIKYDKGHDVTRPYNKYSTSKWDQSIIDLYEILLDPYKHNYIRMFHMGVYHGESLRYFREFFTNQDAKIIGIDIHDYKQCPPLHNVVIEIIDQKNLSGIKESAERHGPFDIIVDDASHDPKITEDCYRTLWPYLKQEGLYLIEDIPPVELEHLLDELVLNHEGKGILNQGARGFGPRSGGQAGVIVLKKTQNLITGLEI